jgi:hypothetical protein
MFHFFVRPDEGDLESQCLERDAWEAIREIFEPPPDPDDDWPEGF